MNIDQKYLVEKSHKLLLFYSSILSGENIDTILKLPNIDNNFNIRSVSEYLLNSVLNTNHEIKFITKEINIIEISVKELFKNKTDLDFLFSTMMMVIKDMVDKKEKSIYITDSKINKCVEIILGNIP